MDKEEEGEKKKILDLLLKKNMLFTPQMLI